VDQEGVLDSQERKEYRPRVSTSSEVSDSIRVVCSESSRQEKSQASSSVQTRVSMAASVAKSFDLSVSRF
jgi:hypothetical protein